MKKGILIGFGELFLKSPSVQKIFKRKLIFNLSFYLKKEGLDFKIYPHRGRIFVETSKTKKATEIIKNVFGISFFAESLFFEKASLKEILDFVAKNYQNWITENETFAIRLKKDNFIKKPGRKIIEEIARVIKRKVNLEKPKKKIFVEARKEGFYFYFKKKKGAGGLPVGTGEKVLSLISGGIDSPVASFLVAKRGAENVWLHFHSFPLVSNKSIEKVKELAKIFLKYQPQLKIYLVPFSKIQMKIKAKVWPKYRILLYRRIMLKIAQKIAQKEECDALVTGESIGQVSSQTLANIKIIEKAVSLPVLRPLIGLDKEEIIKLARKMGTFEISIKPQEDCCTLFTPEHSSAKGNLKEIEKIEKALELKEEIKDCLENREVLNY